MPNKRELSPRLRLMGLLASVIAVVALGLTVLAGNNHVGFGHSVTRGEQMSLLVLAALLLTAQSIAYVIHRSKRRKNHESEETTTAVPRAKN